MSESPIQWIARASDWVDRLYSGPHLASMAFGRFDNWQSKTDQSSLWAFRCDYPPF